MEDKNELISPATSTLTDDKQEVKQADKQEVKQLGKDHPKEKVEQAESSSTTNKLSSIPNLYSKFVQSFENALSQIIDEPTPKCRLPSFDLEGIVHFIKTHKAKNIVFMVGAGISTSAGVPDFRSPGSGLYDNLQKFKLPDPQAIFEMNFFKNNPEPFYSLCREMFPESLKPTPCHYFMRLLDEKGYLRRVYTQNIDSLEYIAGIKHDRIVAAHGSYQQSNCLKCKQKYSLEWLTEFLRQKDVMVPKCSCGGLIKPEIVFFGENLPARFFTSAINDFPKADLLIIIGTSLIVNPFASMVHEVSEEVPRLLINLEPVGKVSKRERSRGLQGLNYGESDNLRDVFWKGTADDAAYELAELLGFKDELQQMVDVGWKKIDEKIKSSQLPKGESVENDKSK